MYVCMYVSVYVYAPCEPFPLCIYKTKYQMQPVAAPGGAISRLLKSHISIKPQIC